MKNSVIIPVIYLLLISSSYTFWGFEYFDRLKKDGEFPANEEHKALLEHLPVDWQLMANQYLVGVGKDIRRVQVQMELKWSFCNILLFIRFFCLKNRRTLDSQGESFGFNRN